MINDETFNFNNHTKEPKREKKMNENSIVEIR